MPEVFGHLLVQSQALPRQPVHRTSSATEHDGYEAHVVVADQIVFQYSRAAKELWKFCNTSDVEFTARIIADRAPTDWWDRGAPTRR